MRKEKEYKNKVETEKKKEEKVENEEKEDREEYKAGMQKKKRKRRIIPLIFFVLSLACLFLSAFQLGKYAWQTYQTMCVRSEIAGMINDSADGNDSDKSQESDTDNAESERAAMYEKYGEIYEKNHDFIGWLKVEGTAIDNPVMFTPDDGVKGQYYLRKNFYGNYDIGGTLFVDYRCALNPDEGISTNTIIYGHRMKNDTMFGPLRYFKDASFCKEHTDIQFDTMYRSGHYVLFAAFLSQAIYDNSSTFKYYDFINAATEEEFDDYLKNIKAISHYYDESNAPEFGDEIITLSTCDYYKANGRLAIAARRIN